MTSRNYSLMMQRTQLQVYIVAIVVDIMYMYYYWRAGASQPSRTTGTLYISQLLSESQ